MELVGSGDVSRIVLTQVGCPLAHGREGCKHCLSSHRFTLLPSLAVSQAKDEQVGDLVVLGQAIQGAGAPVLLAEGFPEAKYFVAGLLLFGGGGSRGELERSAEISCEEICLGRCRSTHGLGCG